MESSEPTTLLLAAVGAATAGLLTLTEQYPFALAALASYAVAWLLLRPAG